MRKGSIKWTKTSVFAVLAACLLSSLFASAQAQTGLKIQLVPEITAIVPGQKFRLGLFLQHDKGWHTYYKQPGIVGVPTSIVWALPPGFKTGELEYPEPEATKMFQIKAQGYERDLMLQTEIEAPNTLKLGESVILQGKATWMCCGTSCHPGSATLSLTLPIAATNSVDQKWQPWFAKERAAYAQSSSSWQASAEEKGLAVTLKLKPTDAEARSFSVADPLEVIFFTEDGWINTDEPQILIPQSDGSLTLKLTRAEVFMGKSTPNILDGIVQRKGGWHTDGSLRSLKINPRLIR